MIPALPVVDPLLLAAIGVPGLVLLVHLGLWVVRRPQRGLLLLAALLPLDGLLLIVPGGGAFGPWKEAALLGTFVATFLGPAHTRRRPGDPLPSWWPAMVAFVAYGAVSALLVGGIVAVWGFKIGYFYLVMVPLVMWRCPFTASDRDKLVTILMGSGVATALYGLFQQVVGDQVLAAMGYEYNTAVRFSGSLLRSFSSFTQPFSFGLFMTMVLLVCLPVALSDPSRRRNAWFLVASPILVVGMATSVVRGAALGLAVGLFMLMVWRFRALAHAAGPAVIAVALLPPTVLSAYFSSSSLTERTTGWGIVLDRMVTAPLGNGVGVTGAAAEKSYSIGVDPALLITNDGRDLYLPDNQYVKTALETGPIGLWLLITIIVTAIVTAVRAARVTSGDDRALVMGIGAAVSGAAAAATVSTYLEVFPLDFYFWLLIGVLTCAQQQSSSTPSPSAPPAAVSRPTSVSSSGP